MYYLFTLSDVIPFMLQVSERLRESLKKWADGEFKGDPQLSLIPALYTKLKQDGYDFNVQSDSVRKWQPIY